MSQQKSIFAGWPEKWGIIPAELQRQAVPGAHAIEQPAMCTSHRGQKRTGQVKIIATAGDRPPPSDDTTTRGMT